MSEDPVATVGVSESGEGTRPRRYLFLHMQFHSFPSHYRILRRLMVTGTLSFLTQATTRTPPLVPRTLIHTRVHARVPSQFRMDSTVEPMLCHNSTM